MDTTTAATTGRTKKEFKVFLNNKYQDTKDKRGSLRGSKSRMYGDYLYSADREYFNLAYSHWLKTGTDEGF